MAENNPTLGSKNQKKTTQESEICTECGRPLYTCGCPERWENEGGPSSPQIDINDDSTGSTTKPETD